VSVVCDVVRYTHRLKIFGNILHHLIAEGLGHGQFVQQHT